MRLATAVLGALITLVLAGCGGDEDSATTEETPSPELRIKQIGNKWTPLLTPSPERKIRQTGNRRAPLFAAGHDGAPAGIRLSPSASGPPANTRAGRRTSRSPRRTARRRRRRFGNRSKTPRSRTLRLKAGEPVPGCRMASWCDFADLTATLIGNRRHPPSRSFQRRSSLVLGRDPAGPFRSTATGIRTLYVPGVQSCNPLTEPRLNKRGAPRFAAGAFCVSPIPSTPGGGSE